MFKTFYYFFLNVCGYFACVSVMLLERGPGHQNSCEGVVSHHWWWGGTLELTPGPLEELLVLLTISPASASLEVRQL